MKTRKTLALLLALIITLLVGCSAEPTAEPTSNIETTSTELSNGTLILSVNPSIAINYDETGAVETVNAVNLDGETILEGYTGFENKEARIVLRELVQRIGDAGFLVEDVDGERKQITIEIEKGSKIPNDQFINEIAGSVKEYLNEARLEHNVHIPRIGDSDYYDISDYMSDYRDTDYDTTDFDDTDYDGIDTDYDDSDYRLAPTPAPTPASTPAPAPHTDYSDYTDYTDYSDYSDYSDYDESDYSDYYSDYYDSDYGR